MRETRRAASCQANGVIGVVLLEEDEDEVLLALSFGV